MLQIGANMAFPRNNVISSFALTLALHNVIVYKLTKICLHNIIVIVAV